MELGENPYTAGSTWVSPGGARSPARLQPAGLTHAREKPGMAHDGVVEARGSHMAAHNTPCLNDGGEDDHSRACGTARPRAFLASVVDGAARSGAGTQPAGAAHGRGNLLTASDGAVGAREPHVSADRAPECYRGGRKNQKVEDESAFIGPFSYRLPFRGDPFSTVFQPAGAAHVRRYVGMARDGAVGTREPHGSAAFLLESYWAGEAYQMIVYATAWTGSVAFRPHESGTQSPAGFQPAGAINGAGTSPAHAMAP